MKKYILGISLMIAVVVIAVAACSKSDSTNTPQPPTTTKPTADATVSIKDFAFSPATITIKTGGTVAWTNVDAAPHTVTDNSGGFDSGSISTNAKYSHAFAAAGTYTYHCTIHSMMATATVVVIN